MKEIFNQIHRFSEQNFEDDKPFEFILEGKTKEINTEDYICPPVQKMEVGKSYKITVKKYMTEAATANFDFQDKWNNGIPMPMCIMQGEVLKETRGMYCMALGGQIERNATYCMCCGRQLTNPISKLYGIGPECSAKLGLMIVESEEEAKEKLKYIEGQISNITWEGWVIKSAIKEWEMMDNE